MFITEILVLIPGTCRSWVVRALQCGAVEMTQHYSDSFCELIFYPNTQFLLQYCTTGQAVGWNTTDYHF